MPILICDFISAQKHRKCDLCIFNKLHHFGKLLKGEVAFIFIQAGNTDSSHKGWADKECVPVRGCRSRLCPRSCEEGSVPGAGHCLIEIIMFSELKRKLLAILHLL